jgi:hypothetical protein
MINLFLYLLPILYRSGDVAIQPYNERSPALSLSNSNLYNAMIYPFMRTVIYGAIWYQGKEQ